MEQSWWLRQIMVGIAILCATVALAASGIIMAMMGYRSLSVLIAGMLGGEAVVIVRAIILFTKGKR